MIIPIKQILTEGIIENLKRDNNYRLAVGGAIAAPAVGGIVGGGIGNFVHGDGDMNPLEAGKLLATNPEEYDQRVNDEYDGTGALIGTAMGSLASKGIMHTIRDSRSPAEKMMGVVNSFDDLLKTAGKR